MPDDPPLLTDATLDELHSWRDLGAPIADELRPGLSDQQMDALTDPLGLRLPGEARRLWEWHDGAPMRAPHAHGAWQVRPVQEFRSLEQCVEDCHRLRQVLRFQTDWSATWLPLYDSRDPVVLDCGLAFEQPVPIYAYFLEYPDKCDQPDARSLGELVTFWIKSIDCGARTYDRAERLWRYHEGSLDPKDQLGAPNFSDRRWPAGDTRRPGRTASSRSTREPHLVRGELVAQTARMRAPRWGEQQ